MNYTATIAALGGFFLWVFIATIIWSRRIRKLENEYYSKNNSESKLEG